MSELKAISSGEIYKIIEYEDCYRTDDLYYPKSEADKVIAELKAQKAQAEDDCAYWKTRAQRERHHKYKRCLAMARWCKDEEDAALERYTWNSGRYAEVEFYEKWHNRWLELAEKFKPNN